MTTTDRSKTDRSKGVGKRVREAREARHMKQVELARKAEIDPVTLFRLEKGQTYPELPTVQRLAAALDVTVASLTSGPDASSGRDPTRADEPDGVPLHVAGLIGTGRLGVVTQEEILFLSKRAREEDSLTAGDLEIELLIRRQRLDRNPESYTALTAALARQAKERGERRFELRENPEPLPPSPDQVRNTRATKKRKKT